MNVSYSNMIDVITCELRSLSKSQYTKTIKMPKKVRPVNIKANTVITAVAEFMGTTYDRIMIRSRKRELVLVRQTAMFVLREKYSLTFEAIGDAFEMDHSTIMHGHDTIKNLCETDKGFKEKLHNLMKAA